MEQRFAMHRGVIALAPLVAAGTLAGSQRGAAVGAGV